MVKSDFFLKYEANALSTYAPLDIVLEEGVGCRVRDIQGREYLDFVAGIAVNSLGHGHSGLQEAICLQAGKLIHCSNLYLTRPLVEYTEELLRASGFDRAFFCNSGTESIEAAIKLARRWAGRENLQGRKIVALQDSFHGRSIGSLSLTGQEKYQKPFRPLLDDVVFVDPHGSDAISALASAVDDSAIAIILEPVQGEGGVIPLPADFIQAADKLRKERDILLIFDEVQCGFGRTGKLFAWEHYGVRPDILCMAKGIAGGIPMGGILVRQRAAAFQPGDHAATFGGNPLSVSAARVVLSELMEKSLLERVERVGSYLGRKLGELKDRHAVVQEVRGIGLMQGILFHESTQEVIDACIALGLLVVRAGKEVLRLVPPLIVTEQEVDEALGIIEQAIAEVF